jgi:hypothetical protein
LIGGDYYSFDFSLNFEVTMNRTNLKPVFTVSLEDRQAALPSLKTLLVKTRESR